VTTMPGYTLDQYAEAKRLPREYLERQGLTDECYWGHAAVHIPYWDALKSEIAVRFRGSLNGEAQFWWKPGTKVAPYGLWRLESARAAGYVVLVEGESDCHTLWFHDIPTLGIPGAETWQEKWAHDLDNIPTIYVVIESDNGGEALRKRLASSSIRDRMRMVHLGDDKGPSGLYLKDPQRFRVAWQRALESAIPWIEQSEEGEIPGSAGDPMLDGIPEGQRNIELFKLGCRLHRVGLIQSEMEPALRAANSNRCQPPLPDAEVAEIAKSASGYPLGDEAGSADHRGLRLIPLLELMQQSEEEDSWVWDGILPAEGVSLLAGSPKSGKSTFARNLALAVARGEPFLGRATLRGPVIYLGLEEIRREVRSHFQRMGAEEEEIYLHVGPAPADALESLRDAIHESQAVLTIVDPMLKLIRVEDVNAELSGKLESVINLARETGCHILQSHHTRKAAGGNWDTILGSTAILGGVDTAILLREAKGGVRHYMTRQRYGVDMPETPLSFDPKRGTVSMGQDSHAATPPRRDEKIDLRILTFIGDSSKTEQEVRTGVGGDTGLVGERIRALSEEEKLNKKGRGVKGNPFRYSRRF